MNIYEELRQRENNNNPIRVGVIGAGQMGHGMIAQISTIPGMQVTGIADINLENANRSKQAYLNALTDEHSVLTSTNFKDIIGDSNVEIVVDATGVPEVGAKIAMNALIEKKHLVLLNVEVDITIGSIMRKLFNNAGLVYTGSDGDEPAAIVELYEFARTMGMEVLVAGKGKNNALKIDANPDTALEEATLKEMSPSMLAAFQDGTKTMAEMNLLSNAIGYLPDKVGMHGISGDLDSVLKDLNTKENGGILESFGVVEYVDGLAPGVFVIVKGQNKEVKQELNYLMKVGERDHHILYRPYHLASLETPITIAKAIINNTHSIVPQKGPVSDTVAVAKKDIKKGELIDGIGGYCVRGVLETHTEAVEKNHIPIGLISGEIVALEDISRGDFLTEQNTQLDKNTTVWKLRKLQDEIFNN